MFYSKTVDSGGVHSAMLTKLQEMDAQLTAIENTAKKVEGEFQDSNQVRKVKSMHKCTDIIYL